MRILIADDDLLYRRLLEAALTKWGYEVVVTCDGEAAWRILRAWGCAKLAILDWMMPGNDGLEVCRKLRTLPQERSIYAILLTANRRQQDIIEGLQAGASDYITKPFDREELFARVQVGARIVDLQQSLADRVRELQDALSRVTQLQGLLPICSYCKKIRDDGNYWQQVDHYIAAHTDAQFSHGICPDCFRQVVEPQLAKAGIPAVKPETPGCPRGDVGGLLTGLLTATVAPIPPSQEAAIECTTEVS